MPDLDHILAFIMAVIWRHWVLLMLTGLPPAIIFGIEYFGKTKKLPIRSYVIWASAVFGLVAVFLAWDDEYTKRLELEKKEAVFNASQTFLGQKDNELSAMKSLLGDKNSDIQKLEGKNDRLSANIENLGRELGEKDIKIRDLQGRLAGKIARHAHRDKFAKFLHDGGAMQQRCFNGLTQSPKKDFMDWQGQVLSYVKKEMSSSHVIRFVDTNIDLHLHFFDENKQSIPGICADIGREIEAKRVILREFISELNN